MVNWGKWTWSVVPRTKEELGFCMVLHSLVVNLLGQPTRLERAPVVPPQVRWYWPPCGTHPSPIFETEVGLEPDRSHHLPNSWYISEPPTLQSRSIFGDVLHQVHNRSGRSGRRDTVSPRCGTTVSSPVLGQFRSGHRWFQRQTPVD